MEILLGLQRDQLRTIAHVEKEFTFRVKTLGEKVFRFLHNFLIGSI